jgi:hypothetical protein
MYSDNRQKRQGFQAFAFFCPFCLFCFPVHSHKIGVAGKRGLSRFMRENVEGTGGLAFDLNNASTILDAIGELSTP